MRDGRRRPTMENHHGHDGGMSIYRPLRRRVFTAAPGPAGDAIDAAALLPVPSSIAGYTVVRRLGQGLCSDTYLGHSAVGDTGQVALKVFRSGSAADSVERELTALTEAKSGLPALIDIATLADGRVCVVLERLRGDSLAHYLARYGLASEGEAVTILAPVIVALGDLHAVGLVHTGLSQASIVVAERGRPVLLGLGSLLSLPVAGTDRTALLRADYARLAVLISGVLGELAPSGARAGERAALVARCDAAATASPFVSCLPQLEHHLFDWAAATALTFGVMPSVRAQPDVDLDRGRSAGAVTLAHGPETLGTRSKSARVPLDAARPNTARPDAARLRLGLTADSAELVRTLVAFRRYLSEVRVRTVARLFSWVSPSVAGSAGSVARSEPRRWSRTVYAISLATAVTIATLIVLPPPATDVSAGPEAAPTSPAQVPPTPPSDAATLVSDDPVAAVSVLLRLRAQCLAAASVACLDATDQADGPLMAADTQSLAGASTDPAAVERVAVLTLSAAETAQLVERTGNSALIALDAGDEQSQPASALVIKGEAGWRLRELFGY